MNEEIVDKNAVTRPVIVIGFNEAGDYRVQSALSSHVLAVELERRAQIVKANIPPPQPRPIIEPVRLMPQSRNGVN